MDGYRAYRKLHVEPTSPHVGAEISNIDLTQPLSALDLDEMKAAIADHLVLFFRDQKISADNLKTLGEHFGPLHDHVGQGGTYTTAMKEDPIVRILHFDEKSEMIAGGETWHTDQSCAAVPPMGSILYLHTVPPSGGGDTMFASMYGAYDALSDRMKNYLTGLTAVHNGEVVFGKGAPISVHPLIVQNPTTGRRSIFFSHSFVTRINDVPLEESRAIHAFLKDHCAHPDYQFRFRWRPHSIAFWDNRYAHHRALWDYYPHTRSGFRVQVQGTAPPTPA